MKIWSTTAKKVIDKRKMGRGEMGNGKLKRDEDLRMATCF